MANIPDIPDYVDQQDYEYILASYLGNVRDDVDKREGSIIWDSGAPCCIEIAKAYLYLQEMMGNVYASTAPSPYLEYRCEEQGITRDSATYAKRLAVLTAGDGGPFSVPIGTAFSTVGEQNLIRYTVTSVYTHNGETVEGSYIVTCDTLGTVGNEYYGEITPVSNIQGLATATLTDVLIPGEEEQDLEDLRQEYFTKVNQKAFGGNIREYREFCNALDGVGATQVYPVWNGGGTVKLSIIDSTYSKPSDTLVETVQQAIDPYYNNEDYAGKGIGTAPIGHVVTVVGASEHILNIEATIVCDTGYTVQQVQSSVEANLEAYLLTLRNKWENSTDLNEYGVNIIRAMIMSVILTTTGVTNILTCTINGSEEDIILQEDKDMQEIPVLGEVTLSE